MIELHNYLPNELTDTLNQMEFIEDGGIFIESIKSIGNNLQIEITLSFGAYLIDNQLWRIDINDLKAENINLEWATNLEIYSDHYLLYGYTDSFTELYFKGKADSSEKLFIDLYSKHIALYENRLEFGIYLNDSEGILKLCTYDQGLFARGPRKILEQYNKCLNNHGIKTNFIGYRESEDQELKLLVMGKSYFIGKEFYFSRIK